MIAKNMAYICIDLIRGSRLSYTGCSRCTSLIGISLSQTKTGDAVILPEVLPVEIQRMCHSEEGTALLYSIVSMPNTVIYDDHILLKEVATLYFTTK